MQIIIGDKTKEAMSVLMLETFPFSEPMLKKNYRELIFKHHPDRNKNSEASIAISKQITNAFNLLENLAIPEVSESEAAIVKGQYKQEKLDMFTFWEPCKRCNATGKIIISTPITIKEFYNPTLRASKPKFRAEICPVCKGKGENKIEVFNPIIPKGAVMI